MTGQIVEGKSIQIVKGVRSTNKVSTTDGINISRMGKPVSGSPPIPPKLLTLVLRCCSTNKDYQVIIEETPLHHYKIEQILKVNTTSPNTTESSLKPEKLDININDIENIQTLRCPYCSGGQALLIKCGCGRLSCGGGIRQEGQRRIHKCPWCQRIAPIGGDIDKLGGEKLTHHTSFKTKTDSPFATSSNIPTNQFLLGNKEIQKR